MFAIVYHGESDAKNRNKKSTLESTYLREQSHCFLPRCYTFHIHLDSAYLISSRVFLSRVPNKLLTELDLFKCEIRGSIQDRILSWIFLQFPFQERLHTIQSKDNLPVRTDSGANPGL
jgi:hypothetical protein